MARAVAFYGAIGFERLYGGETATFTSYRLGETFLNLILTPSYTGQWWGRVIFRVDKVDALHAAIVAQGMTPEAARLAARREMGSPVALREAVREAWLASAWDAVVQDARHAFRSLRATPATSALAIATFAPGTGAVAAILSVLQATLLTPPPYREPSRLVMIWADLSAAGFPRAPLSGPELRDLRQRTSAFEGLAGVWANSITLTQEGEPEFVRIGFHQLPRSLSTSRTRTDRLPKCRVPSAITLSATANSGTEATSSAAYSPTHRLAPTVAEATPASWCRKLR